MSSLGERPLVAISRLLKGHRLAVLAASSLSVLVAVTSLGLARAAATLLEQAMRGLFGTPLVLALLLLGVLRLMLGIAQQRTSTTLGHRIATELREALIDRALRADIAVLPSPSELLTRIAHDVTQVQSLVAFRAPSLLSDTSTSLALVIYAVTLSPETCAWAALPGVIALPLLVHHARKQSAAEDKARAAYSHVYEHVADTLEAGLIIRHHHAEKTVQAGVSGTLEAFEVSALQARHRATRVTPIPHFAALAAFVLAAYRLSIEVQRASLSPEDALALVVVLSLAARPLLRLASLSQEMGANMASVRRVAALLSLPLTDTRRAFSEPSEAKPLRVEAIQLARGARALFENASLHLRVGEMTAITGENGAGKSSLLLALAGLITHEKRVLAEDKSDAQDAHLEAAWVPQVSVLIQGTLQLNVAMSDHVDVPRCLSALRQVGMDGADLMRPVTAGGRNLSLGERHKVALARALYLDRCVLLLDEPTASLDATSTATFLETLKSLRGSHAILLVSHDPQVIAACDRVLRVEAKTLVEA